MNIDLTMVPTFGLASPELLGDTPQKYQNQTTQESMMPAVGPAHLEMTLAREALEPFRQRALAMESIAKTIVVNDDAAMVEATKVAGEAKRLAKSLETARKNYLDPLNEHVRGVNGLAKEILAPLERAENILKKAMSEHMAKQEIARRQAEEQARREAAEAQAKINAEAKAAGVTAPVIPEVVQPKTESTVRTEGGTAYTKSAWVFELADLSLVPLDFLALDEKKIREAIRGGMRTIPGLKIFEQKTMAIRS